MGQANRKKLNKNGKHDNTPKHPTTPVSVYGLLHAERAVGQIAEGFLAAFQSKALPKAVTDRLGGPFKSFAGILPGSESVPITVYHRLDHEGLPRNMGGTAALVSVMLAKGHGLNHIVDNATWIGGPVVFEQVQHWPVATLPHQAAMLGNVLSSMKFEKTGEPVTFLVRDTGLGTSQVCVPPEFAKFLEVLTMPSILKKLDKIGGYWTVS